MARARHAVLVGAAHDPRDLIEVEHRRRRADQPLDGLRPPRVVAREGTPPPADDHVVEEDQLGGAKEEGADRDEQVPVAELGRVVRHAAGHALHADPVHRQEGAVHADQGQPEVKPPELLVVHPPGHLREPVVDAREDREHRSAEEHEVDVGDDEVGVGYVDVDRHHAEHHAADPAHCERDDEAEGEEHRRGSQV